MTGGKGKRCKGRDGHPVAGATLAYHFFFLPTTYGFFDHLFVQSSSKIMASQFGWVAPQFELYVLLIMVK